MKPRIYKGKVIEHIKSDSFYGQTLEFFRVKKNIEDQSALHHGSFDSLQQAKDWIDQKAQVQS